MKYLRTALAIAVTVVVLVVIDRATALPVGWHGTGQAMLRLSWRARPERIEHCRAPSAQELEQMAEHMRQRLICEGTTASYELRVTVDGVQLDSQVVRGGGMRHDRPLQLLHEYSFAPGDRHVRVSFQRRETPDSTGDDTMAVERNADSGTFAGRAGREASERDRGRQAAIPPDLVLDTTVTVTAGAVALITFDPDTRSLNLVARNVP